MGTIKTTNIEPIADNGTVTLGSSGDTITVPTGVTVGGGMSSTPSFLAILSSSQTIADSSYTKLTMNTEVFDNGGCYDNSSNYRFTPTTTGKYYVYVKGRYNTSDNYENNVFAIYKNGSSYAESRNSNYYYETCFIGVIIDFNGSSDYVEAYTQQGSGSNKTVEGSSTHQARAEFGAYKLIGV